MRFDDHLQLPLKIIPDFEYFKKKDIKIIIAIDKYATKSCLNKILPIKGISDNKKNLYFGQRRVWSCQLKVLPANPVRPVANIVKPNPVAT